MSYQYSFTCRGLEEDTQNTTLSVQYPLDVAPEDILESYIHFMNIVYGWDVRKRLSEYLSE
jgi:hypothetical protein